MSKVYLMQTHSESLPQGREEWKVVDFNRRPCLFSMLEKARKFANDVALSISTEDDVISSFGLDKGRVSDRRLRYVVSVTSEYLGFRTLFEVREFELDEVIVESRLVSEMSDILDSMTR